MISCEFYLHSFEDFFTWLNKNCLEQDSFFLLPLWSSNQRELGPCFCIYQLSLDNLSILQDFSMKDCFPEENSCLLLLEQNLLRLIWWRVLVFLFRTPNKTSCKYTWWRIQKRKKRKNQKKSDKNVNDIVIPVWRMILDKMKPICELFRTNCTFFAMKYRLFCKISLISAHFWTVCVTFTLNFSGSSKTLLSSPSNTLDFHSSVEFCSNCSNFCDFNLWKFLKDSLFFPKLEDSSSFSNSSTCASVLYKTVKQKTW